MSRKCRLYYTLHTYIIIYINSTLLAQQGMQDCVYRWPLSHHMHSKAWPHCMYRCWLRSVLAQQGMVSLLVLGHHLQGKAWPDVAPTKHWWPGNCLALPFLAFWSASMVSYDIHIDVFGNSNLQWTQVGILWCSVIDDHGPGNKPVYI